TVFQKGWWLERIFHDWLGGRGQNRRTAGFSRCHRDWIADFPIGRVSKFRGVRGFGNPRYGRLGSLRYRIAYEISALWRDKRAIGGVLQGTEFSDRLRAR